MQGFRPKANAPRADTAPPTPPVARSSHAAGRIPVVSRAPETLQRLSAERDPALDDAVEVEGDPGAMGVVEEQVQTLRPAGQGSGRAGLSGGALNSPRGGAPLAPSVRQFMEPRFGADFSGVQVHADGRAAELAGSVSARAFAYGKHLYFNQGEYRPETDDGKRVLAHELTHVVQQGAAGAGTVRRLGPTGAALRHMVAPWGTGPLGANYEASTDAGSAVSVWRGYPIFPYELLFWCHGHSLGTMPAFGYSVYSGLPLETVLADEWTSVPAAQTRAGDIAVWTAGYDHSALFTRPVVRGGSLDHQRSELSTKNGQRPLATMTLEQIEAIYGTAGVAVFRRK